MKYGGIFTIGSCILVCIISFLFSSSFFANLNEIISSLASSEEGGGGGDPTPLPPNPPPPPPPGVSMVIQFI